MHIILDCTKDALCIANKIPPLPSNSSTTNLLGAGVNVSQDYDPELYKVNGNRLKREKPWLGQVEDTIHQVYKPSNISPGEECIPMPVAFHETFSVIIKFDRLVM